MWKIPFYRLGAAIGGAILLGAAALGIAGAAGGGNVAGDVLQTLHVSGSSDQSGPSSRDAHGDDAVTATPERTPKPRVAADNPDGHCVMLPSTSDIIRHPDKHPKWHALGGACPTETPAATVSAASTGTPTPAATPTPTGTPGTLAPTETEEPSPGRSGSSHGYGHGPGE